MARTPKSRMLARQAEPKNENNEGETRVAVTRSPDLPISPVDMCIMGFMGRDLTITGLANYPAISSMMMDTSSNAIGPNSIEYEQAYRETVCMRLAPASAGQLAFSIANVLKESDPEAFENLRANLEPVLAHEKVSTH